ncbi:hypothetical protein [Stenomitos frigidus]|uniref:MBL fold metallo-hydrolase n=1 Tax=Stenomitos frigidus ULC18 TaxID=2107698 RepID=A0A2T1EBN5_9CYAN|nr:hypothetical protein [Stenomitos frigidus]PSB30176.1 hypothetical protein C7B82_09485 [Stenomitos frigidus ULC18]
MLDIKIFDVDHGFCAAIDTGDRHTILLDCGYNVRTGFRPAQHIFQQRHRFLDGVILPTYSQGHLAGITALLDQCFEHGLPVNFLIANPSLDATHFPGLTLPMQHFNNVLSMTVKAHPECSQISHSMTLNDIKMTFFWNQYPDCQNVHNLSLVTFLSYRDLHVIFPGDLEVEGWQALLQCHDFRDRLKKVNAFIAADHGREEGYCSDVFNVCSPEVIIISNQAEQALSPQLLRRYESHVKASRFNMSEKPLLTTHEDGAITITKYLDAACRVSTQPKVQPSWR